MLSRGFYFTPWFHFSWWSFLLLMVSATYAYNYMHNFYFQIPNNSSNHLHIQIASRYRSWSCHPHEGFLNPRFFSDGVQPTGDWMQDSQQTEHHKRFLDVQWPKLTQNQAHKVLLAVVTRVASLLPWFWTRMRFVRRMLFTSRSTDDGCWENPILKTRSGLEQPHFHHSTFSALMETQWFRYRKTKTFNLPTINPQRVSNESVLDWVALECLTFKSSVQICLMIWVWFCLKKIVKWNLAWNDDRISNRFWNDPKYASNILYCGIYVKTHSWPWQL